MHSWRVTPSLLSATLLFRSLSSTSQALIRNICKFWRVGVHNFIKFDKKKQENLVIMSVAMKCRDKYSLRYLHRVDGKMIGARSMDSVAQVYQCLSYNG
jgi:hypothetical protein